MKNLLISLTICLFLIFYASTVLALSYTGNDDPPDWYLNPPDHENAIVAVEVGTHQAEALILALLKAANFFTKKMDDLMLEYQTDSSNGESYDITSGNVTASSNFTSQLIAGIKVEGLSKTYEEVGVEIIQSDALRLLGPDNSYIIKYYKDTRDGYSLEMSFTDGKDYLALLQELKEAEISTEYFISETKTYVKLIVPFEAFD